MRGHKHERKPGVWALVIFMGRDADGKQRRKTATAYGGERVAQRELNRLLAEAASGQLSDSKRLTVAQFLERWLTDCAAVRVRPKTLDRYREIVHCHLVPSLGACRLDKLTPVHIQQMHAEALKSGRRDGSGGLSAQTVLHHHRVLRTALGQAVDWDLLARNPCDRVQPPQPEDRETPALSNTEMVRLFAELKDTPLYLASVIAGFTSLRRGEVLGLRWQDLDLSDPRQATLTVNQSLQQLPGGRAGLHFVQPKTKKSRRVVELPESLVVALIRHRGKQAEEKLALGPAYHDGGLVVCDEYGRCIIPNQLTQRFGKRAKELGLSITFHGLRHSHATALLNAGEPVQVVSARLGHSLVSTTVNIYSHVLAGQGRGAATRFGEAMSQAAGE